MLSKESIVKIKKLLEDRDQDFIDSILVMDKLTDSNTGIADLILQMNLDIEVIMKIESEQEKI